MAHRCLCKMRLCSRTLRVGCPWPCGGVSARPGGGCGGRAEGRRSQTQGLWSSVRTEDACSWGPPGPPRGACSLLPPAWSLGEGPLPREQSSPVLEAPRDGFQRWGVVLGPLRFLAQAQRLSWALGLGCSAGASESSPPGTGAGCSDGIAACTLSHRPRSGMGTNRSPADCPGPPVWCLLWGMGSSWDF